MRARPHRRLDVERVLVRPWSEISSSVRRRGGALRRGAASSRSPSAEHEMVSRFYSSDARVAAWRARPSHGFCPTSPVGESTATPRGARDDSGSARRGCGDPASLPAATRTRGCFTDAAPPRAPRSLSRCRRGGPASAGGTTPAQESGASEEIAHGLTPKLLGSRNIDDVGADFVPSRTPGQRSLGRTHRVSGRSGRLAGAVCNVLDYPLPRAQQHADDEQAPARRPREDPR